jgi:hypothetical protein
MENGLNPSHRSIFNLADLSDEEILHEVCARWNLRVERVHGRQYLCGVEELMDTHVLLCTRDERCQGAVKVEKPIVTLNDTTDRANAELAANNIQYAIVRKPEKKERRRKTD